MPASSLRLGPTVLANRLRSGRTLPYHHASEEAMVRDFGGWLKPRYIVGARKLDR
jgi:hypothetical protein